MVDTVVAWISQNFTGVDLTAIGNDPVQFNGIFADFFHYVIVLLSLLWQIAGGLYRLYAGVVTFLYLVVTNLDVSIIVKWGFEIMLRCIGFIQSFFLVIQ